MNKLGNLDLYPSRILDFDRVVHDWEYRQVAKTILNSSAIPGKVVSIGTRHAHALPSRMAPVSTHPAGSVRTSDVEQDVIAENDAAQKTILVVDDEGLVNTLVTHFLSSQGYSVIGAANAQEALEKVKTRKCALVLLDLVMPGIGGLELARWLKHAAPSLPIIFLSGSPVAIEDAKRSAFGDATFLAKPVWLRELLSQVAKHLSSAEAPVTA